MVEHPWSTDVDHFLAILLASQLLNHEDFRRASLLVSKTRKDEEALARLCTALIEDDMITEWQCEKLRNGKFKGFYFENYCLLSEIETTETEKILVARDLEKGIKVELAIAKPTHERVHHRVVRVIEE